MPALRVELVAALVFLGCGAGWAVPHNTPAGEFLILWLLSILLLLPLLALALLLGRKAQALDPAKLLAIRGSDSPPRRWLLMLDFQLLLQHLFAAALLGVAGPALWLLLSPLLPALVAAPQTPAGAETILGQTEALAWMLLPLLLLGAWLLLLTGPRRFQAVQALGWLLLGVMLAAAGWRLWTLGFSWPAALQLDGEGFAASQFAAAARLALVSLALGMVLPMAVGSYLERSLSFARIAGQWLLTLVGLALLLLWVTASVPQAAVTLSPVPAPQLGFDLLERLLLLDPLAPERAVLAIALVLSSFLGLALLIPTAADSLAARLHFEPPLATALSITVVWCLSMVLYLGLGARSSGPQNAWPIDVAPAIDPLLRFGLPASAAWLALYGAWGLGFEGLRTQFALTSASARLIALYLWLLVPALAVLAVGD